LYFYNFTIF